MNARAEKFRALWRSWMDRGIEAEAGAPAAPAPAPVPSSPIHKMPPGAPWVLMLDTHQNARLASQGVGWRNYEAIQLWRDGWDGPAATFSEALMYSPKMNAYGLWWRPLPSAAHTPRAAH